MGAIFLGGGDLHACTGSVLHSAAGNLVLTAAHCLAGGPGDRFVPGFAGNAAPADVWTVDALYLDPRWVANKDPRADYAIARVSRAAGGSVEAQVGSALSLGSAPARGSQVTVVAYPAGVGGMPIGCQASTGISDSGYPELPCAGLVDGTSGAPWISGSTRHRGDRRSAGRRLRGEPVLLAAVRPAHHRPVGAGRGRWPG